MGEKPLSQGAGYGIILGVGFAFAFGMIAATWCLKRYRHEKMTSDEFSTAGRRVNSSLISVGVVSSWCWPTSILVSAAQVYNYGVCGGLFYAAGCGSVCFFFAVIALEVKRKAPGCHTYLELIKIRFGTLAHCIFTFFALAVNMIVTVELINGASEVFEYLTGMHIVAASFLVVIPVSIYTLFGGLKATFLTDYVHSIIMLILALVFAFNAYTSNSQIGSIDKMYDLLQEYAEKNPVEHNQDGSLMTIRSQGGGLFLLLALSSALSPIFLDQGYWNKALAAAPKSVVPGYIMGGIAWCAIPMGLATVMGLSLRVLENTESFPGKLTAEQISAGLVLPSAATALMGKNGAACAFLLIFMSVTSAASAEMVSASTVISYDIYRTYLNPRASDKQLMWVTHLSVIVFVLSMVGFSIGLYYAGVNLGYLFDLIAIICGGALAPACLTLFWSGLHRYAATWAPVLGTCSGVAVYLGVVAALNHNVINMTTATQTYPNLAGMLTSVVSPLIYVAIIQIFTGHAHFDFSLLAERQPDQPTPVLDSGRTSSSTPSSLYDEADPKHTEIYRTKEQEIEVEQELTPRSMLKYRLMCLSIPLALIVLWPWPMYGSHYVFSRPFFRGWIVVSLIWIWVALLLIAVLPLWQGRDTIKIVLKSIARDLRH